MTLAPTHLALAPLLLLPFLVPSALAPEPPASEEPFPASTALAEGLSPEALASLGDLVQSFVDDEEVVGAELLVVKNGRTVLHEAYGWTDREAGTPMETGRVFCVRSMTKPLVGAAILMLIDEDRLELDDPVARYLPEFDAEGTREITVEQLLTHTSGLPMSSILGRDLRELDGVRAVAALGGGLELEFEPGAAFRYSDQGTDTLTALIEVVSGVPAADFVRARLLDPLGMGSSACVLTEEHPLRARAVPKYVGTRGAWTRFWSPEDPPLFPFFLGSQGLYSSLEDYARFLDLWMNYGRVGRERLVRWHDAKKALRPGPHPMGGASGFPGLTAEYGFLMQLWVGPGDERGAREVTAFGHTGSDGTHAWAFPEQDAMVLYFTQSRNNPTGLRVEEALGELLLGVPYDANVDAPPFEQYLGYYREHERDRYRTILRDGDDLALEILGKGVVPLTYLGDDRWKMRPNPSVVLAFGRSEHGEVTGYRIGEHREFRFEPDADLPGADQVAARVAAAHRLDLLESLGPLRFRGALNIEKLGLAGSSTTLLAWPDRFRFEGTIGEEVERLVFDGERVRYSSTAEPADTLAGPRADSARLDSTLVRFGDWRRWYPALRVIQRLEGPDGEEVLLVRAGDTSAPARTLYVHGATGRVFREDSIAFMGAMGRIGQSLEFGDFRDVSGMLLPYRTEIELANPMIGTIVSTIEDVELDVELAEDAFELEE